MVNQVQSIRNRTKCFDLFYDVKVNDYRMYPQKPMNKVVQYRVRKKKLYHLVSKLNLLKNLKAFSGFGRCTYMEIVLKEIELAKEMFLMDLCMGDEVIMP